MSEKSGPKPTKYDNVSGTTSTGSAYVALQGGMPPKKSVEAINAATEPKTCPSALGK